MPSLAYVPAGHAVFRGDGVIAAANVLSSTLLSASCTNESNLRVQLSPAMLVVPGGQAGCNQTLMQFAPVSPKSALPMQAQPRERRTRAGR